jgi:hypothetical protein
MFQCIVCDPDARHREGTALGLFYTAVSRATTLGDSDGHGSAIYFVGPDFDESRIRNIGKYNKSDEDYKRVAERDAWVAYLRCNMHQSSYTTKQRRSILHWASTATYTYDFLYNKTRQYVNKSKDSTGNITSKKQKQ